MKNKTTVGKEVNLLKNYPKSKRNVSGRANSKTVQDCQIAQKFGKDFFDGSRRHGYGGFSYHPHFWGAVIPDFISHWDIQLSDSLLDIGCAKGFMLFDLLQVMPELNVFGIDISEYAINNAKEEVKEYCRVANAIDLPFEDKSVDIILSITTLHNLDEDEIKIAISEIERVKIRGSFITVDAYRDDYEKDLMESWNLTAKTVMHVDKWKEFFHDNGYTGDYYWFIP
ncbi:MAG: class I SAM-dependent methyltransferase [Gammaproteobacteria bacterium]|jgi:SAM-dependent methyltransferase|nr:class I SAM-dependent methyltransferase [Gammaproteobacteria bacterium]|tara:strand:+ start:5010 stop:5687 length:678 start_codon:yes stop_codon:yes gene_type:complete